MSKETMVILCMHLILNVFNFVILDISYEKIKLKIIKKNIIKRRNKFFKRKVFLLTSNSFTFYFSIDPIHHLSN